MNQVHPVVLEFACDDNTVGLVALGVLAVELHILALDKAFLFQGRLKPFGIVVQGRMGHDLVFADADHFRPSPGTKHQTGND